MHFFASYHHFGNNTGFLILTSDIEVKVADYNISSEVKVSEYNIRSEAIRWRISTCINVIARISTLAFIVMRILKNVDIEIFGLGLGVQPAQS